MVMAVLPKPQRILEREFMEYRPFGLTASGEHIRDVSGVTVKANVDYLEERISMDRGSEAGAEAVIELTRLLNQRIRDTAYHVTPAFLKNTWNSYSYEFVMFLADFCLDLSGDPEFQSKVGREKFVSPLIATLGRPFSVPQIYKMWAHFGDKYVKGSLIQEVVEVGDSTAVLRVKLTEKVALQFGPYLKSCALHICQSAKAALASIPDKVHHLPAAKVTDRKCIAAGDEWCEWEFVWQAPAPSRFPTSVFGLMGGVAVYAFHRLSHPEASVLDSLLIALVPALGVWLITLWFVLRKQVRTREQLIQEQLRYVEARHEELREAYLEQEQVTVELKRKVTQLSTLHHVGLIFNSTLEREGLIEDILGAIIRDLHYDRAMISFYDRERQLTHDVHILGVPADVADFARSLTLPVTDPDSVEGQVLLQGKPVLIRDVRDVRDRLHPLNQQLAEITQAKSIISVPLKVKDSLIGALTVDRVEENSLTTDDLNLMVTVGTQVAIALDNAIAYRQIEELNVGLEAKVRKRTEELQRLNADLENANSQLQEMDRLKSLFLSHVSHELRTPLTSIKGFVENMLSGLTGTLEVRQEMYLTRMRVNADRLLRMISNLLDRSRLEFRKMELSLEDVQLPKLVGEVVEQMGPIARAKRQQLELHGPGSELRVRADWDKLSQIVTNLVDNAIKYTPEDGRVTIEITREAGAFAKVAVSDTGEGIDPQLLPNLFDPFFRVRRPKEKSQEGVGLGLSIVKDLVELHGGKISVLSRPGEGSTFEFTIPTTDVKPHKVIGPGIGTRRILVVDDDADIRQLLLDRLRSYGYDVSTAVDGREALTIVQAQSFDGVLLDIGMPEIDGLEVLRQVREAGSTVPVVMVTASGAKQRAVDAVRIGAQAYLLKPFDAAYLKETVERWFGPAQ
jgi:signal transduction histidine kinase/CheY-like chemotaxis protein